jgi:hypothetical protein
MWASLAGDLRSSLSYQARVSNARPSCCNHQGSPKCPIGSGYAAPSGEFRGDVP